jgi:proteasome lid subunit RPN8/RPN11
MKLNKDILNKLYDHALKEYPDECCGIITGTAGNQIVHLCTNIQNQLHAEDPVRYPRDAHTAYTIDRSEFDRIITPSRQHGNEVIALYHSHCDHESYFSEEDVAAQTVFGEPEFPDALHVVVSVMNGRIHDIKGFQWDGSLKKFFVVHDFVTESA